MSVIDPADALTHAFLRKANDEGTAALVVYGVRDVTGKPAIRVASNVEKKRADGILNFLQGVTTDEAVIAAAKALAAYDTDGDVDVDEQWGSFPNDIREDYLRAARVALEAAKKHSGRTLNMVKV